MYNSDVRKLYDLKDPAWKYDIMPEIMDGHNVSGAGLGRGGKGQDLPRGRGGA